MENLTNVLHALLGELFLGARECSGRHCGVSSQGRCLAVYQPKDGGRAVIGHRGPHFHSHFQGLRSNPGELCSHCFLLEEEVWLCFTLPTSAKDPGAWKYPETVLCSRDGLVKQMTVALTSVSPAKLCSERGFLQRLCSRLALDKPVCVKGLTTEQCVSIPVAGSKQLNFMAKCTSAICRSSATGSLWTFGTMSYTEHTYRTYRCI